VRHRYVGVQLSIPISTGFTTTHQVKQAEAQVDQDVIALDKARQQVALQVWASYQTLQSDSENLAVSARLETVATQAWDSAQRRYQSGIGTILELITTQTSLAQARQERVEALTTWRYDRLALGAALGHRGQGWVNGNWLGAPAARVMLRLKPQKGVHCAS
jgi:outer membrane protein